MRHQPSAPAAKVVYYYYYYSVVRLCPRAATVSDRLLVRGDLQVVADRTRHSRAFQSAVSFTILRKRVVIRVLRIVGGLAITNLSRRPARLRYQPLRYATGLPARQLSEKSVNVCGNRRVRAGGMGQVLAQATSRLRTEPINAFATALDSVAHIAHGLYNHFIINRLVPDLATLNARFSERRRTLAHRKKEMVEY